MIDKLIQLSIMSGGLLPVMAVLLLITLAVIVERAYFFHRVLKSGHAMEHDLQLVEYQNAEKLVLNHASPRIPRNPKLCKFSTACG